MLVSDISELDWRLLASGLTINRRCARLVSCVIHLTSNINVAKEIAHLNFSVIECGLERAKPA